MIITIIGLLIIASVPLTGGRLGRMSQLRFTHGWLVALSLALQIAITVVFTDADRTLLAAVHILSYLVAGVFLWLNRAVPGLLIIAAGGIANFVAISANGGLMPASPRALEIAGMVHDGGFENSTTVADAKLQFLGDIFAIPAGMPFANVFSIGDIVLLVGVGILVHTISRRPAPGESAADDGQAPDGTAGPDSGGPDPLNRAL